MIELAKLTDNTNKLISLLGKNLYSNEYTFINEVISNAIDSHKKANQTTRPVEVIVDKEGYFYVIDYGVGLTLEEFREKIGNIGFSDKLNDDTQIGKFGIGTIAFTAYTTTSEVNSVEYTCIKNQKSFSVRIMEKEDEGLVFDYSEEITVDDTNPKTIFKVKIKDSRSKFIKVLQAKILTFNPNDLVFYDFYKIHNEHDSTKFDFIIKFNHFFMVEKHSSNNTRLRSIEGVVLNNIIYSMDLQGFFSQKKLNYPKGFYPLYCAMLINFSPEEIERFDLTPNVTREKIVENPLFIEGMKYKLEQIEKELNSLLSEKTVEAFNKSSFFKKLSIKSRISSNSFNHKIINICYKPLKNQNRNLKLKTFENFFPTWEFENQEQELQMVENAYKTNILYKLYKFRFNTTFRKKFISFMANIFDEKEILDQNIHFFPKSKILPYHKKHILKEYENKRFSFIDVPTKKDVFQTFVKNLTGSQTDSMISITDEQSAIFEKCYTFINQTFLRNVRTYDLDKIPKPEKIKPVVVTEEKTNTEINSIITKKLNKTGVSTQSRFCQYFFNEPQNNKQPLRIYATSAEYGNDYLSEEYKFLLELDYKNIITFYLVDESELYKLFVVPNKFIHKNTFFKNLKNYKIVKRLYTSYKIYTDLSTKLNLSTIFWRNFYREHVQDLIPISISSKITKLFEFVSANQIEHTSIFEKNEISDDLLYYPFYFDYYLSIKNLIERCFNLIGIVTQINYIDESKYIKTNKKDKEKLENSIKFLKSIIYKKYGIEEPSSVKSD